jgi:hypothetical protein
MALARPDVELVAVAVLVPTVVLTAVGLGLRQWYERRRREPNLSKDDVRHFARQDVRRAVVGMVMVLLALGIGVGSRVAHQRAGRANPWFLATWLAVFGLILVLLCLALVDWVATWLYGRRHRRKIAREQLQFLREQRGRRAYRSNGRGTPRDPINGGSTS